MILVRGFVLTVKNESSNVLSLYHTSLVLGIDIVSLYITSYNLLRNKSHERFYFPLHLGIVLIFSCCFHRNFVKLQCFREWKVLSSTVLQWERTINYPPKPLAVGELPYNNGCVRFDMGLGSIRQHSHETDNGVYQCICQLLRMTLR